MNILLLGEYSGFFKNLKSGFESLGHNVLWVAGGDGWKAIPGADINLDFGAKGVLRKPMLLFNYYRNLHLMKGFDVVLIINPSFFKRGATKVLLEYLAKHNGSIYLSACGDDYHYIKYGKERGFRWWPFMNWGDAFHEGYLSTPSDLGRITFLMDHVRGVIPTCYDYSAAWKASQYSEVVSEVIGLPVVIENDIHISKKQRSDKIVLFHGLNREWFKGTDIIRPALEQIKLDYPQEFDLEIKGGLPYSEYIKLLDSVDIIVDQCKVYSYGSMNAVISMARGKVVAGCLEEECLKSIGLDRTDVPVIPLRPDSEYIYNSIVSNVVGKDILKMKMESLNYVADYHESKVVAQQYISLFSF